MTPWYRMPAAGDAARRAAVLDARCLVAALACVCRLLKRERRPQVRRALRVEMLRVIRRAAAALDRL